MWEVEFTDEFEQWWDEFTEGAQEALDIAQEELGELLGIKQAAVSRMERRSDMHISKLRKAVEAMGGELILIARFPNAEVCLNNIAIDNG
ncbi:MAG: transcriptional regulator [Chloroflexi bacterium]|nr:MAG: transcriptional regulator [Chloroflexota bacterium]